MAISSANLEAADDAVADARAGIAAIGKQWNGNVNTATQAIYAELQRTADRSGVRMIADVEYGDHPLQGFDLFVPEAGAGARRPIVIYLHGGGLVRGDKIGEGTDGLIYSNVGYFFARHGIITLNANYRLVPEVTWPAGQEDIRLMLAWIDANIGSYGGDANRVFLMGNSAGSTHVATYLFSETEQFADGPRVIGALLSSGAFAVDESDTSIRYFGADAATRAERSPLGLVDAYEGKAVPLFLWSAELDPTFIETSVASLYAKLCSKYADCPRYTQFQGHNHVSHVMSLNSADSAVGDAALEFIHAVLALPGE